LSDPAKLAIIVLISVILVLSYPALMYPPIRRAARRASEVIGSPFRAIRRAIRSVVTAPGEVRRLRAEVLRLASLAEQREEELTEAAGRMWLETQVFPNKPRDLIRNADRNHGVLAELHSELRASTYGQPVAREEWFQEHEKAFRRPARELWWQVDLWLTWAVWKALAVMFISFYALPRRIPAYRAMGPGGLRELVGEWRSLTRRQARLRGIINGIPERTRAFNAQESARELARQHQKAEDAQLRPLKAAEVALEGAKGHIRRMHLRRQQSPTKGSAVLSLDQALQGWQARVQEIEQFRAGQIHPEELIRSIRSLERDMALAGSYAARVVRIERRAQQLQSLHKRLRRRSRGHRLPDEQLKVVTIAMRDVVSQLWVEARWDELSEVLNKTLENIRIYEREVLARAWHLKAGTFEQLLAVIFRPGYTSTATEIRFNPEADPGTKRAADGSAKLSPFAHRVQEYADGEDSRFAHRK
jgi:hypothetical protein